MLKEIYNFLKPFLKDIIYILLIILLFNFVISKCNENKYKDNLIKQNELAFNDSLKYINDIWSTKYAFVENLQKEKENLLKEKNETIISKNKIILQYEKIIAQGNATHYDTVLINQCLGAQFSFENQFFPNEENKILTYNLDIKVLNPPFHKIELSFEPLEINTYLTRNKEGIWSGYIKLPEKFSSLLKINDANFFIEKDEYLKVEELCEPYFFSILPSISFNNIENKHYIFFNLNLLIKEKYFVGFGVSNFINQFNYMVAVGFNVPLF